MGYYQELDGSNIQSIYSTRNEEQGGRGFRKCEKIRS